MQVCAQAVELTLGLSEADLANGDDASFAQLGGDSLAAIQFARAIDDLCGVPLPVSFVLDHSNSLAAITAKARGTLQPRHILPQPRGQSCSCWRKNGGCQLSVLACAPTACSGQVYGVLMLGGCRLLPATCTAGGWWHGSMR